MTGFWLRNGRAHRAVMDGLRAPADRDGFLRLDLRIEDGKIAALAPLGTAPEGQDLRGGILFPGFVDAHTHLDKGHIWPRARNADGSFLGALTAVMADRGGHWGAADMAARADFALRCALAHGTVAIRTHLDTDADHAAVTWGMFSRLRDAWAGRIALQASSIAPLDQFVGDGGTMIADTVVRHGGILGMVVRLAGDVHAKMPAGFQPMLERFFALAEDRGLDLDLHVDESGESGARALGEIARTALRRGFKGRIQCGHCCALAIQPEAFARETIAAVADAGIAIVVLPMCNMYLQDRVAGRTPRWRGVTLVHELAQAGVPVSLASDNTRDPFYAYGDLDMLEVLRESTRILHLDHPTGAWPAAVCRTPAEACGFDSGVLRVGATADLVLTRARMATELLSRPWHDRVVLRAGRVLEAAVPDYAELDGITGFSG
ncbi:cytosine deaminase [Humitalea rosea]|uniref:Cytosine deaminase n=1 Tax=Humitalea rosea TaxID=990373 RepID=A0A2W7IJ20_9PROT|nr:cytosine deaminase [Humitalea rosea]PZW46638.1 cytosine deaminase [Humitalea rosea]